MINHHKDASTNSSAPSGEPPRPAPLGTPYLMASQAVSSLIMEVGLLFIYLFFNVGPPKEDIFLTTFYSLYFSFSDYTCYNSSGPLRAASMYCINSCPCDLWALLCHYGWFELILLILKCSLNHDDWHSVSLLATSFTTLTQINTHK